MAYYDTIYLVAGDDKPDITLTLRDSNTAVTGLTLDPDDPTTWNPIDLTNVTVQVHFRALGGTTILDTLSCANLNPFTDGKTVMSWNPTTLDISAGTYEGEIELTYIAGQKMTVFDKLKFKVRDDF